MSIRVTLKDRVTGVIKEYPDTSISVFDWTEGNWSCDCNRSIAFTGKAQGGGVCVAFQYEVVNAVGDMEGYTTSEFIADCNTSYQEE